MARGKRPSKSKVLLYSGLLLFIVLAAAGVFYGLRGGSPEQKLKRLHDESYQTYRKGDFKQAIPKLTSYLELNASDVDARNVLITSYVQVGDVKSAMRQAEMVLDARPRDGDALYRAGLLAAQLNRPADAAEYLEKAIAVRPGMTQYHYRLAEVYADQKRYDNALAEWERVLAMLPKDERHRATIYGKIATIHTAIGLDEKARDYIEKGLSINPDDPYIKELVQRGRVKP